MATKYTGSNEGAEGLRVRDQDGNPNVKPVNEIRVTNGTLTDNGDGVISLQTGGGGGGGGTPSGPAGAVQLSDGGGNFTNDAEFNFDTTNDRLEIGESAQGVSIANTVSIPTIIDSWSISQYRSARYQVQITNRNTSEYQVSDINLLQNGTDTEFNEFGTIFTGSDPLGTFSSNISGGVVRLIFTPPTGGPYDLKVFRTLLEV